MRRDMELIQKIATAIESLGHNASASDFYVKLAEYDLIDIRYHINLMMDAGYLEYSESIFLANNTLDRVPKLTWEGHDYCDSLK